MFLKTETGSLYEYDTTAMTLTRHESTHELRRDGEALKVIEGPTGDILGSRPTFLLEPLGAKAYTSRTLSTVVGVMLSADELIARSEQAFKEVLSRGN